MAVSPSTKSIKISDGVASAEYKINFDELKQRLHGRQSETKEAIATRLSWAERELEAAKHYDYQVVNEDLKTAYEILRSILIAEEHKNR